MNIVDSLFVLSVAGILLLTFLLVLAVLRARRTSRAELRAFKELGRTSGLVFHRPNLLRGALLIGSWHSRAAAVSLGLDGLSVRMNLRTTLERRSPEERRGEVGRSEKDREQRRSGERRRQGNFSPFGDSLRAFIRYPAGKSSPTWGISSEFESTYHITGDREFLELLSDGTDALEDIRGLSGEFDLAFLIRGGSGRPKSGRMTFRTQIAVSSADQLQRLLDALRRMADFVEER